MDPLSVTVAVLAFVATGRSICAKIDHLTHAPVAVKRLSRELKLFEYELATFTRQLSYLPDEHQFDRKHLEDLISEAHGDLRTLDTKLRKATRQVASGIEVRRLPWLVIEGSCQQIELNLAKTVERLARLRTSLLVDKLLCQPTPDQVRADRELDQITCESVNNDNDSQTTKVEADAELEKWADDDSLDTIKSLASKSTVLRTSSTHKTNVSTSITAMHATKPITFSSLFDCNCQNFSCRTCRKRSRTVRSLLSELSARTCFGQGQSRVISPEYSLVHRGTLPQVSDANRYARTGNIGGLKRLIEDRAINLSMTTADGWTILHNAAHYGQLDVINFLMDQGCRVDCEEDGGRKPADLARMKALRVGAAEIEQEIALKFPDVESFSYDHELTPVHIAVLELHACRDKSFMDLSSLLDFIDDVENASQQKPALTATRWSRKGSKSLQQIVRFYDSRSNKETGASKQRIIDVADALNGFTPFLWATITGRLDAMRLLLRNDADPFTLSGKGRNAVHLAAESRSPDVMSYVLSIPEINGQQLDINHADFWKENPLHIAASVSAEITRLLLESGADRTAKQACGQIPLHYACLYRTAKKANERVPLGNTSVAVGEAEKAAIVDLLTVDLGSHIDAQDEEGRTPIFDLLGSAVCVEILVNRGASTNIQDNSGNSPMHEAAIYDYVNSLKVMLRSGQDASIDAVNRDGHTPLALAVMHRSSASTRYLLQHHGTEHISSEDRWSLIHHAAAWGDATVLEAVLRHRSFRQGAKTLNNESAADIAKSSGHWSGRVKELLKEYDSIGQMARRSTAACSSPP